MTAIATTMTTNRYLRKELQQKMRGQKTVPIVTGSRLGG